MTKIFGLIKLVYILSEILYIGKFGLELAQAELRAFKTKYGRLPKYEDKDLGGIIGAINRREWFSFGIETWNDLLRRTFGEVNSGLRIYAGKQGMKRAIAELKDYKIKHKRLPANKTKRWVLIRGAVNCGEWISFGVGTWDDLLIAVNKDRMHFGPKKICLSRIFSKV